MRTWNKVFKSLHLSTTTSLTSLFIHIVDITPWDVLLIHNLSKLPKMLIDGSLIEALGQDQMAFPVKDEDDV